jgi:hypothetical protein
VKKRRHPIGLLSTRAHRNFTQVTPASPTLPPKLATGGGRVVPTGVDREDSYSHNNGSYGISWCSPSGHRAAANPVDLMERVEVRRQQALYPSARTHGGGCNDPRDPRHADVRGSVRDRARKEEILTSGSHRSVREGHDVHPFMGRR